MSRPVYCDESIWAGIADGLRQRGREAHTAREEDLLGAPDEEQLAFAVENDWILFTFDDDFLTLVNREGHDHRGIVYTDQAGKRVGDIVKSIDAYLNLIGPDTVEIHYL